MHRIQKKLYKAYGKVAKKLGEQYEIYRPDPFVLQLDSANYIDTKYVSISSNDSYSSNGDVETRKLWIDGRLNDLFDIQSGDYLINPETNEALLVSKLNLNLPLECIECNARVSIEQTDAYSDTGSGWSAQPTTIAQNLPARVRVRGNTTLDGGFIPAQSAYEAGNNTYEIRLSLPEGMITNGCVITHGSVRISAQQIDYYDHVYTITGVQVQ